MLILGTPDFDKSQVDILQPEQSNQAGLAVGALGGHWVPSGIERVPCVVGSDTSMHAALMGELINAIVLGADPGGAELLGPVTNRSLLGKPA